MRTTRAAHPSFRSAPPKCPHCGLPLPASAARVQLDGRWYCPDGAYLETHPYAATLPPKQRVPKEPQKERLPLWGE